MFSNNSSQDIHLAPEYTPCRCLHYVRALKTMRSVGLTVLGLLLLSWGGYSVYGIYDMAVVRDVYTPQLTILVSVMALSSLLSGLGALNRKAWSLKAYVVFAGVVLALMVYTKDFGMESSDKVFMIAFFTASIFLFLAGLYLRRQLIEKL